MNDSGEYSGDDSQGQAPHEEEEGKPSASELEAAGQNSMFGGAAEPDADADVSPTAPTPQAPKTVDDSQPYRVLARKYRPQTFSELIGQDPMVQTLSNAIERDRLAHAFLMTGVRGVGKTSTARLIAKALNCIGKDGQGGATIDPCGVCEPCTAIAEGRHIDVIEMDAASHTGVDDVREIIEAVRYAAVSARYKIYIIDEVHMLSRNAFNALLKTLEEPPAHVKFLFATTEVDKLPVTVLSRTQRFDLRRIPAEMLAGHFSKICTLEGVGADEEALAMVAKAAEGSVRDGLSILDQAIAHADLGGGEGAPTVSAEKVRDMLGLADRGARQRLFDHLLKGEPQDMLALVDEQYSLGVEPLALMRSLMDQAHKIALAQIAGGESDAPSAEEQEVISTWSKQLTAGQVHRLWQLLLKGHDEVRQAPDPLVSTQMALLRVMHASDMPDPGKLAKELRDLAASGVAASSSSDGASAGAPSASILTLNWEDLVEEVDNYGALQAAQIMRDWVRVVELEKGKLIYQIAPGLNDDPRGDLRDAIQRATGEKWIVEPVEEGQGEVRARPSLRERQLAAKAEEDARIRSHPLVAATLQAFPDAKFIETNATGANGQGAAPRGRPNWSKSA